jgi:DNA repair exonuclease SbcCD nuclease subunit
MRIFTTSDWHFGAHSSKMEQWLGTMSEAFNNVYIPYIEKHAEPGDAIMVCGDIFDNRNSINLKVAVTVTQIVERMSKLVDRVYILVGNHDMWAMSDTEINACVFLKYIPGVTLIMEPTEVVLGGKTALMLPWIDKHDLEKQYLKKYDGKDYLFCHSDLQGCRTQVNPTRPINRSLASIEDFKGYGRVYSGHIHINQQIANFTFVGSPYHLDRNDRGNRKGMYVIDTEAGNDTFVPNEFSPEFKILSVTNPNDIAAISSDEYRGHYVDLHVKQSMLVNHPGIKTDIDATLMKYTIQDVVWIDDSGTSGKDEDEDEEIDLQLSWDVKSLAKETIMTSTYSEDETVDENFKKSLLELNEEVFKIHEAG